MRDRTMLNLYTEVAFQAAPPTPASIQEFQIPRKNGSYDKSKYSDRTREPHTKNERDYVAHHLASASDFYFREHKIGPRCILWRVVGESTTLELHPADLARSENETNEAHITLRFSFQDAILPG